MDTFVNYIVESGLSLGVFTLIYWFILRKETLFRATRVYLLFALLFSTFIPFLTLNITWFSSAINLFEGNPSPFEGTNLLETVSVYASGIPMRMSNAFLSFNYSMLVYGLGALAVVFVIVSGVFQLYLLASKNRTYKMKRVKLVVSEKIISPYSFFNFIFIGKDLTEQNNWKTMVHHELEHVKQGHSFDVLFIDLMMVFQWFNPFYWMLRRMVRENHEFLADTAVLSQGFISRAQYKVLLLSQAIGGRPVITSNFLNVKTVKKRFKIITNNKNRKYGFLKYATGVVMALALILLFACEYNEKEIDVNNSSQLVIYNGQFIDKSKITDLDIKYLQVVKVDKLDALMLYPELKDRINDEKITIVFNAEDKAQKKLLAKLEIKDFSVETNGIDGVTVVTEGKGNSEEFEEEVFIIVEDMPEFPGGELELRKYIAYNIKYPTVAVENGIQGKVYVTFVVSKDGSIIKPRIARGVDITLDAEAVRVVSSLPKWKPGKQRGKAVNVRYTIPINFTLQ